MRQLRRGPLLLAGRARAPQQASAIRPRPLHSPHSPPPFFYLSPRARTEPSHHQTVLPPPRHQTQIPLSQPSSTLPATSQACSRRALTHSQLGIEVLRPPLAPAGPRSARRQTPTSGSHFPCPIAQIECRRPPKAHALHIPQCFTGFCGHLWSSPPAGTPSSPPAMFGSCF